jgi:hypothetical protein
MTAWANNMCRAHRPARFLRRATRNSRSLQSLLSSFDSADQRCQDFSIHPRPEVRFGLDAENRLLLRVLQDPKRKSRSRGRTGDKAVTRRKAASDLAYVSRRLRKLQAAGECLLRSC